MRKSQFSNLQRDSIAQQTDNLSKISEQLSDESKGEHMRRLPKRKITEKTKKRMTMFLGRRKEIEEAAQQLESKKFILKSNNLTQTTPALMYSTQIDQAPLVADPTNPFMYKSIEKTLKKHKTANEIKPLIFAFLLINSLIIGCFIGISIYSSSNNTAFDQFLAVNTEVNHNLQASRMLLQNILMTYALKENLVNESRYNILTVYDSSSKIRGLSSYSEFLELQRNDTIKALKTSSDNLVQVLSSKGVQSKDLLGQSVTARSVLSREVNFTLSWSAIAGQLFRLNALAYDFNNGVLNGGWPQPLLLENLLNYLMNYLPASTRSISSDWYKNTSADLLENYQSIQYFVFAIVFLIMILISAGVFTLMFVIRKLTSMLKTFSLASPHHIKERMIQLKSLISKMEKMRETMFYVCDQLDEAYILQQEEKVSLNKPNKNSLHYRETKFLFPKLGVSLFLVMIIYLSLAGLTLGMLALISSSISRQTWLRDKKIAAEDILFSFENHFNEILALIILKNGTIENKPYSEFFSNYEEKLRHSMTFATKLVSQDTSSSSSVEDDLLNSIQTLYSGNLCNNVAEDLSRICDLIDSQYPRQGMAQVERHLAEFYAQVYFQILVNGGSSSAIINQRDFVELEFAFIKIYEPAITNLLKSTQSRTETSVTSSLALAYIATSLLAMLVSMFSYRVFDTSFKSAMHVAYVLPSSTAFT